MYTYLLSSGIQPQFDNLIIHIQHFSSLVPLCLRSVFHGAPQRSLEDGQFVAELSIPAIQNFTKTLFVRSLFPDF